MGLRIFSKMVLSSRPHIYVQYQGPESVDGGPSRGWRELQQKLAQEPYPVRKPKHQRLRCLGTQWPPTS